MKRLFISILLLGALQIAAFGQGCDAPSQDGVNLFGFIQGMYEYNMQEEPTSEFYFERVRLGVTGDIPYDFSYYAVLEASPFMSGEDQVGAYLLDAFITYNRFNWAKLSVGAFKNGFGLETNTACHSLHSVYRSATVLSLNAPFRDMGLMLMGGDDTTFLKYNVAVLNGTGLLTRDTDTYKDFVGRVRFSPSKFIDSYFVNHLRVGLSGKYGLSAPFNEPDTPEEDLNTANNEIIRMGADIDFSFGNFLVQSEFIYGINKGASLQGADCTNPGEWVIGDKKQSGVYVQAMYMWRDMIQPVVKYEFYKDDLEKTDEHQTFTTLGVNVFFNDWTRLQLNYVLANEYPREFTGTKNMAPYSDQFVAQIQVKF